MCDSFYVYANGNQVLKIVTTNMAYDKSTCAITLFQFKSRYFMYVHLMGDNGDGPCNIYVYEKDKFRKVLDVNNFMENIGYHTDAEVQMVGKNKFTLRLSSMSHALAASSMACDFTYKNGKLIPVSKIMKVVNYYNWDEYYKNANLYSKDRQPYLTVARQLKLYKSFNMKENKGTLNKGDKVKILKCYRGKDKVVYQMRTKTGKTGWFSISNGSELDGQYFKEIMYAG